MAIVVEVPSKVAHDIHYRQVISPSHITGSFIDDDTNDHQWKVDGRGKGRLSVSVDNPADNTVTVKVYGMHSATGLIADAGTFLLATFTVTPAQDKNYQVITDPYPWYLIQVTPAAADATNPTVTIFIDFLAF